ncbi:Galectin [Trichostrongylus colubriformis]|uniref:Galectin n=1 Tax=Trichostrongylus colubriformis TaxID=6319 RepID=A0AAN8GF63_TRICO
MASFFRRFFNPKKPRQTRKDSVTGRNKTIGVPYLSRLEGNQLQPGQSLIVRGVITGTDSFVVNLTSGPIVEAGEEGEVLDNRLLSIRCDISKNRICFNACVDGEWGKEGAIKQHYKVNDEFDLRIRCFEDQFHIYVEHRLVAKFAHYVPMNNISHVYVNGEVLLYGVSWEGKFYSVPYAADIPGNFYAGRRLFVSGLVPKGAKQFLIDFHANAELACRIKALFPVKKVLRTSRLNDRWGPEERIGTDQEFPFKRKQTFDLLIYCNENKFEVLVNDCPFATFDHRIASNQINKLSIEGDVSLLGVHLK